MTVRRARWLVFGALVLALPVPMLGPFDALVPPVRYAILLGAGSAVALAEGAAGPVPGILALLAFNLAVALAGAALLAWLAGLALAGLAPRLRAGIALAAVVAMLLAATASEPYETGFGRAPRANLPGVLH